MTAIIGLLALLGVLAIGFAGACAVWPDGRVSSGMLIGIAVAGAVTIVLTLGFMLILVAVGTHGFP